MDVDEKGLCADWLAEFPLLKRYKGGRKLLRICDPVVFGIELRKVYSTAYRPEFVAMSLLSKRGEFGINEEAYTKRNLQFSIDYRYHTEEYSDAVEAMRKGFPILSVQEVGEEMIVGVYRESYQHDIGERSSPLGTWTALVETLKYFGRTEECAAEKAGLLAFAKTMHPDGVSGFGGYEGFVHYVETEVDAPMELLLARRVDHLAKGGWDKLPGVVRSPRLSAYEGGRQG